MFKHKKCLRCLFGLRKSDVRQLLTNELFHRIDPEIRSKLIKVNLIRSLISIWKRIKTIGKLIKMIVKGSKQSEPEIYSCIWSWPSKSVQSVNIKNHCFEKNLFVWSWILLYLLETQFPSLQAKNPVEFRYLELFWRKCQHLPIFHWKSAIWTKSAIVTSLWHHTRIVSTFLAFLKRETHSYTMVQNKHTFRRLFVKFIGSCNTSLPPWLDVLHKIACLDDG